MLNRVVEASMFKGRSGEHDEEEEEEEGMNAGSIECFGFFFASADPETIFKTSLGCWMLERGGTEEVEGYCCC